MIGASALAIWFDFDPVGQTDLDAWYPQQHLPERLGVPGFLRGRRYAALRASLPYLTFYETRDAAVLSSPAYLERLNHPTEWTRRVLPRFRGMVRNAYRLLAASPTDRVEQHLLTARIEPGPAGEAAARQWLARNAVPALALLNGVRGCGLYASETAGTAVVTEERRIVGGEVVAATPFLAVSEVADVGAEPALRDFWETWGRAHGARVTVDLYRLLYGLAWL